MSEPAAPVLRVVHGAPTAEELAVVTALVSAGGTAASARPPASRRGGWSDPAQVVRRPLLAGPGAWRAALR